MSEEFEGFVPPTKNYFPMPNEWIDICAQIDNLAELKVIQYVLRHTWGYHEYSSPKAITVDEFMYGRKRADGSRIDNGTGLKSDRSVKDGLKAAIAHGYLIYEVDKTDKARIKKSYALKMIPAEVEGYNLPPDETRQVDTTPQTGRYYPSEVQNLPLGGAKSTPRSEKDTKEKHLEKDTKEKQNANTPTQTEITELEEKVDTKLAQIKQQQDAFWSLWCNVWFNKDIPPKRNDKAEEHIALLAPFIKTTEQLESLIDYAKKDLEASQGIKRKKVYLGNLVNSYSGWKQEQKPEPTTEQKKALSPKEQEERQRLAEYKRMVKAREAQQTGGKS